MESSYEKAGVDIKAGEEAVSSIKEIVKSTFSENVLTEIGSFGSCYAFPVGDYKNPVLVSSTDGVGTKLILANLMRKHDSIGQCLVNHCVNDILTIGAKPLYFLDYVGTGKLNQLTFQKVIAGLSKACKENGCSLIGGETAEMPGIYHNEDYDLAGTITGVVEREHILTNRVKKGDILIGLKSSGLHTNGYSLARKVLLEKHKVDDYIPEIEGVLGEILLNIHRSYLHIVKPFLERKDLHGISHITGGGIEGNTKRIVSEGMKIKIDWNAWDWLPIFKYIMELGAITEEEMRRVFNLGIGLILVVAPQSVDEYCCAIREKGEPFYILGEIQ